MKITLCYVWLAVLLGFPAHAQTTAFTYQGQLGASGSPANGNYDLRFRLLATNTTVTVLAGPVTNAPVWVTNGLFTTTVDFGAAAFDGSPCLLEIAVRAYANPDTNAFTVLAPDQEITSTPYAIQALNAAAAAQLSSPLPATNITGTLPATVFSTNVALLSSNLVFSGSDVLRGVVTATNTANVFIGSFSGNGAGLTGLPATNLTGILPNSLLSSNVAMLNATNANFSSNVTAVLYTGSGHGLTNVPGAFFWLPVNGTNAQASSNLGFIVTNNVAPVIITLPANPSVGDTFRVAGVGAGGWILVQNAGQSILAGNLADTTGLNWVQQTNAGVHNWTGLSSSADGTMLVATSYGYIYISTNSGVSWTNITAPGSLYWSSVAASTSGNNLVATVGSSGVNGYLYTSVNGGFTWTTHTTYALEWSACASSANGSNLVAVATGTGGGIYTSTNAGSSWVAREGAYYWTGVASSADGTHLVAVGNPSGGGYIYMSTNSGVSWQQASTNGPYAWSAVACSSDGSHLVATIAGTSGSMFASANGGATWFQENNTLAVNWAAVASSTDGSQLSAVYNTPTYSSPGYVYTSSDSGSTWLQRLGAPSAPWTAIACSADGGKLVAAAYNGYIYTSGQGSTSTGTNGYLTGGYQSALELQYVGGGVFMPLSHEGTMRAY